MSESTELTVAQRAAVALKSAQHEQELKALASKYADITAIRNSAGREQAHGAMMELANRRISITKAGKEARDDATKFSKAVIEEERRLVALIEPEETRLRSLRDTWDAEREREKQAKAAAEKARVDGIRAKIDEIKACPASAVGKSSSEIQSAIDELFAHQVTLEEFAEFAGEADLAKCAALGKLQDALVAQQAHEAEQERIRAERAELERLRAEQAERDRIAAEKRAAEERRIAEARAAEEARLRAEREAHEAELRRKREAEEARMRVEREAEEARLVEQRREIERQQAEIAAAKAEQERIEREAREAAEAAARAEAERIAAEQAAIAQAEADRIFAEQQRLEAERRAAAEEQIRREREQFATNGPGDVEIVKFLAHQYDVSVGDVMGWMKKFDYAAADQYFAAANMEKAA